MGSPLRLASTSRSHPARANIWGRVVSQVLTTSLGALCLILLGVLLGMLGNLLLELLGVR